MFEQLMLEDALRNRPWIFWSALVRDQIASALEVERDRWQLRGEVSPKGFPVAEQHVRDMERAYSDLLTAMGYPRASGRSSERSSGPPASEPVGMGEEPAP